MYTLSLCKPVNGYGSISPSDSTGKHTFLHIVHHGSVYQCVYDEAVKKDLIDQMKMMNLLIVIDTIILL